MLQDKRNDNFTQEQAVLIENETKNQKNSQKWFSERRQRLTASNFGQILSRLKSGKDLETFAKNLLSNKYTSKAMKYGIEMEKRLN